MFLLDRQKSDERSGQRLRGLALFQVARGGRAVGFNGSCHVKIGHRMVGRGW